jgi:formylglycine-generating enzyme
MGARPLSVALLALLVACEDRAERETEPSTTASAPRPAPTREPMVPPAPPPPPEPPEPPQVAPDQASLLALFPRPIAPEDRPFFERFVDVSGPGAMNHGNPAIAKHAISRKACLAGLDGVVLQTPEQKAHCGGHDNMVPIYPDGDPSKARTCIDVFEFPNRACELPFVWVGPTIARETCEKLGKRLCTQEEWMFACAGDPAGGPEQKYAYGDALDLTICNTNKPSAEHHPNGGCDPSTIHTAWKTCGTHTEPSGAFPRCRSRFGVYDQHGNVAEEMTRYDQEKQKTMSQLKGSAFFYVDVKREPGEKHERKTYVDVCRHDPRWHVEPMTRAWHVNYHLGFRCCLDVK